MDCLEDKRYFSNDFIYGLKELKTLLEYMYTCVESDELSRV